jgi:hypothetical protein
MASPVFNACEPQQLRRCKMRSIRMAIALLVGVWTVGAVSTAADRVRILDKCDPATFNATLAGVICDVNFDGGVTLDEFSELLTPAAFGHPAWRFNAPYLEIEANDTVSVRNHGGEDHTFTEVDEAFGGGRVAAFNTALGLTARPDCAADVAPPIHPGEHIDVKELSAGTHYFMCCIHPWMHAVMEVSPHD